MADFAPGSLAVPASVNWSGTFTDSEDGPIFESKSVNLNTATSFTGSNIDGDPSTGTYTYTKTGANQGTIQYTAVYTYQDEGDSETESGTVNLTFTSATGGTFTSSGTWSANGFSGTFTNGSGTFTYDPSVPPRKPRDLVGTWIAPTSDGGVAHITFLDDGTYHHTEDGSADDSGTPGLEVGNYTWNTVTGALSTMPTLDQNGEWGLSHNSPDIRLFVNDGKLELLEGDGIFILERPASSVSAIVGSWVIISDGRPVVLVFLADGTYRHSEVGLPVGGGFSGMETGTYTWNPTSGALSASPILDQNGQWGLSDPLAPYSMSVSGDQLTILEGGLSFVGQRADAGTALSVYLGDASVPYDQRGPLDDPDRDGIPNLMEYVLGLGPKSPGVSGLPAAVAAFNPATGKDHLTLTMKLNPEAEGVVLTPQVTSSLSGWDSGASHLETVSDTVSNGVRTWVVRDRTAVGDAPGGRFMRLSVSQSPPGS